MNPPVPSDGPRVAIVGGGLAGLAAAVALGGRGWTIDLYEARRRLGGRAGSFEDRTVGETIDLCQHVSMGCCTNLADFCRRVGIAELFRRDREIHFFGPDGRPSELAASPLPAPLHLLPSLLRLSHLSARERFSVVRDVWRLARTTDRATLAESTILQWLDRSGSPRGAIDGFWSVVLVSALSETLDRISLGAARQVIVDGFMANREGYVVEVPRVPLVELYGARLESALARLGIAVHLGTAVREVVGDANGVRAIRTAGGEERAIDLAIAAVPWSRLGDCLSPDLRAALPELDGLANIEGVPITGVHLWFDRPIVDLPHAVLVGGVGQWIFRRDPVTIREGELSRDSELLREGEHLREGEAPAEPPLGTTHYYQIVISASKTLADWSRDQLLAALLEQLRAIWPAARDATLVHHRVVTERDAVFSVRPGMEPLRPPQDTSLGNLFLAGDWTATGWPSTMEGAVKSGYLAAEAVLRRAGCPSDVVAGPLRRGWLTSLLLPAVRVRSARL